MMDYNKNISFKRFLKEKVWVTQDKENTENNILFSIENKWDIILFAGEYNPITRKEFLKILNFIDKNRKNESIIDGKTLIGLVSFNEKEYSAIESKINEKIHFNLSLEERNFITSKFFGLKLYEINGLKNILSLIAKKFENIDEKPTNINNQYTTNKFVNNKLIYNKPTFSYQNNNVIPKTISNKLHDEEEKEINLFIENLSNFINKNFIGNRILFILDRNLHQNIPMLSHLNKISGGIFTLGFLFWDDEEFKNKEKLLNIDIPFTGEIIKAVTLLDNEKPSAENLKYFAHKFKLSHYLKEIKQIHMKFNNESYHILFKYLFPPILISKKDNEDIDEITYIVVMKMIGEMFLNKNKYLL